ncbi:MAG: TIGR02147 family protein [Chitinivibrionales bacterium]|nr:TIGR02147 family protein [Chitinivibrionales bacterium]
MPDIYDYLDYRAFLRDAYQARKKRNSAFSFRYISRRVGLSASTLVRIFKGERSLSERAIGPMAVVLRLDESRAAYFEALVRYCQARGVHDRQLHYAALLPHARSKARLLLSDHFELFTTWYCTAIRELLHHFAFTGDYRALANKLAPAVTAAQARHAVALLKRLKLVAADSRGRLRPTDKAITVGEEWRSQAIAAFQKATIALAGEAIERFPPEQRDISTVTVNLSKRGLALAKERIRALRKEVLQIERTEERPDAVYQVNLQLFPLSKPHAGDTP